MATLISRIFRKRRSKPEEANRTIHVSPELSIMNEPADESSQPRVPVAPEPPNAPQEELSGSWTMEQVLNVHPSAQRALFQQYHVGGCSSCGFQPSDTLEAVCVSHELDVGEVIEFIKASQEVERQLEVSPQVVAGQLKRGDVKLLDVRTPEEYAITRIAESTLIDQDVAKEIIETWPKDTAIVTVCHHGVRSLDAAAYLKGHGFQNVKSMNGGIDAWSIRVDPSVARY